MQCSRCAANVPDTTTTCPQCGTRLKAGSTTTFSYLPPGIPPWPANVAQTHSKVVASNPATTSAVAIADPPSRTAARPRSQRSASSVVGTITVLVLAPILGIVIVLALLYSSGQLSALTQLSGAPHTAAPTQNSSGATTPGKTSLPAPTSFKTAKDSTINVSLSYPADWTAGAPKTTANGTSITLVQNKFGINFSVIRFTDSVSATIHDAQQLDQANIQELSQGQNWTNVQTVSSSEPSPSIAGNKWTQNDATFIDDQNIKQHFTTIAVQHGKSYYEIVSFVPDSVYQDAMEKYFKPIFKSVKFLS